MSNTTDFVIENGVLVKYTGTGKHVTIPDGVTEIGARAFQETDILSVTIPDSVEKIGPAAFQDCAKLKSVTIPNGVKKVSESLFFSCQRLASVTLPDSLESIGAFAFCDCSSLREVVIPEGVTRVGRHAFWNCTNLVSINLPETVKELGERALADCPNLMRLSVGKKAIFDQLWKVLPKTICMRMMLTSVRECTTDPNMITKIKANRDALFAEAVEQDDEAAVTYLFSLYKKIPLEKLDEYIPLTEKAPKIRAFLLAYKNQQYSPEYQAEQEEIQTEKEFGLREKTLADWKKEFTLKKEDGRYVIRGYRGQETVVSVPSRIAGLPVVIDREAFCPYADRIGYEQGDVRQNIQTIAIAEGVTEIGDSAFWACYELTALVFPAGVTRIERRVLGSCRRLASVTIPDGVTYIGANAFSGCEALTEIALPDSVTEIQHRAFLSCKSLTSFTFPAGVTRIEPLTLSECTALTAVTIPDSVTRIGREAFSRCISLTTVTIPENVALIEGGAFTDCGALTDVYVTSPNTVLGQAVFENCPSVTIHAPEGSAAARYARTFDIPFVAI